MAEAARPRPIDYFNPRPLILGACFFWGIAMGFCLFYFSPPKQMMGPDQTQGIGEELPQKNQMTDQERRRQNIPELALVEPAPESSAQNTQARFEAMTVEPPAPSITTDGGLTGRTAQPLQRQSQSTLAAPTQTRRTPPPMSAPPPIPELMP